MMEYYCLFSVFYLSDNLSKQFFLNLTLGNFILFQMLSKVKLSLNSS